MQVTHPKARIEILLNGLLNPDLKPIDLSLVRIERFLAAIGSPQERMPPVIHVAGTNGKGSTIAFLRAFLEANGLRVHTYTSPHLLRFNERIVIAGEPIGDTTLEKYLEHVAEAAKATPVTFFEATTALAFLAFVGHPADIVLLETGLGGRLDATNVIRQPLATVITPIGLDHAEYLGKTLPLVAAEKAGIIKSGVPCISAHQVPGVAHVIRDAAARKGAPFFMEGKEWRAQDFGLPAPALAGEHQKQNAALAAATLRTLDIEIKPQAVKQARWPGRLQHLIHGPLAEFWPGQVMLDGAHNPHAAAALAGWIEAEGQPVVMICGMMRRKDAVAFFTPLAGHVEAIACIPVPGEEGYTPQELAAFAGQAGMKQVSAHPSPEAAATALLPHAPATLLITGSLFLVGSLLENHD